MNLTFRKKLIFTFAIVVLFISYSIILIMNNYNYESLKEEFFTNSKNHASQVDNNLSNLLEMVKNNVKFLASSPNVTKADSSITALFNMNSNLTPKKYSKTIPGLESTIYNELERYANTHSDTAFVFIGTIYGGFIRWPDGKTVSDYDPRKRSWYIDAMKEPDNVVLSKPYTVYDNPDFPIITASTTIKDTSGKVIGVMGLDISLNKLSEVINNLLVPNSGYIFLINNDGTIIAHPNKELNFKKLDTLNTIGYLDPESDAYFKYNFKDYTNFINENNSSLETIIDGKPVLVNLYTSNNTGWKIATVIPQSELIKKAASTTFFIIISMISIAALAIIFIIVIIKKMTKPLSKLTTLFEEVGNGNFEVRSDINTSDEFKELGDSFNKMTAKLNQNKEMEEKLKENELLLREKEKEELIKNEFFANISHELKTPVNVIYSAIQLESNYISNLDINQIVKYNNTIKQNCLRLIRLINNIIDITRIETGFLRPEFKTHNIVNLIEDITLSVISYAEAKHIEVIFDTEYEELYVNCDANLIERIMLNLLSNSVKYSKENGLLQVTIYKEKDFVAISVKDDGIGIPENLHQKIFERFQRVDKSMSRPAEGSGIGLSLVKSLLEIQKGTISLKSKLNEGAEFLIKLPITKENPKACITDESYEIKSENHIIEKVHVEFSDIYK